MLDVLIEPDVSGIPLMEFKSYKKISNIGYESATKVLAEHGLINASAIRALQQRENIHPTDTNWQTEQLHS